MSGPQGLVAQSEAGRLPRAKGGGARGSRDAETQHQGQNFVIVSAKR